MPYNPFEYRIVRPEYNVETIKKIFDTFPRLLRVKQLTSEQLVDEFRREIVQKNIRIDELLRLLDSLREQSTSLDDLTNLIDGMSETVDTNLSGLLQDLTSVSADAKKQTRIDSLLNRGFSQVGETELFVKVNSTDIVEFRLRSDSEGTRDGGVNRTLKSPSSIVFSNTSQNTPFYFLKREFWDYSSETADFSKIDSPTNVFIFDKFTDCHKNVGRINPGREVITNVKRYNDSLDDIGLLRNGSEATWTGTMYIYASESNTNLLGSGNSASIGALELYRKRGS